jgi:shikimate dehydrogenase
MEQRIYGLIGFPLSHSFSKAYFEEKFRKKNLANCSYENFEIPDIGVVSSLFAKEHLQGLNVTIPYKKQVIPYLNELDDTATKVGAVNCLKRIGASWKGFNTDVAGFENSLKPLLGIHHTKALVLGTGGAAQAVFYVMDKLGITVTKVSRLDKEDTISFYDVDEDIMSKHQIIINTTPLGTFPDINEAPPIPYQFLSPQHLCFDLNYNPEVTLFLKNSISNGAQIKNGYEMLVLQAEASWKIWNTN